MKNIKLLLELDLGYFGEEDEYEPSINPDDWYEYFYQSDIVDLIDNIIIKEVQINDTKMENRS